MSVSPGPRVEVRDVGKVIGPVTLLAPTSVTVEPGRALVVRGRNGIGKTTLLRIVAGLLEPTTGSVAIDASPADERDQAQRSRVAALIGAPAVTGTAAQPFARGPLLYATWALTVAGLLYWGLRQARNVELAHRI